jgi:hypothetical protein
MAGGKLAFRAHIDVNGLFVACQNIMRLLRRNFFHSHKKPQLKILPNRLQRDLSD